MKVLIACERSGVVRSEFRKLGHNAWSNDLVPADDGGPHILGDCFDAIDEGGWDLIIMHPPCTALAVSGNRWYGTGMPMHKERIKALKWTSRLWDFARLRSPKVAMENPVGVMVTPTQYIQPWQFGHGETKKTGLWLWGLQPLKPTNIVEGREARIHKMPPSADRARLRSETYAGIAKAMAEQWGGQ